MIMQDRARAHVFGANLRARPTDERMAISAVKREVQFNHHKVFKLPEIITWNENPYDDRNWQFNYHSLRWIDPLRRWYEKSGDEEFGKAYGDYLCSWLQSNGDLSEASPSMGWHDMATAYRTEILTAAIATFGPNSQYVESLRKHAEFLSEPSAATVKGNHALHVRTSLLIAADVLDAPVWKKFAADSIGKITENSIDVQGVDGEGAMSYQYSIYGWFGNAFKHLRVAGVSARGSQRVVKMPQFIAYGTGPDLYPIPFGDSDKLPLRDLPSDEVKYVRTQGAQGKAPRDLYRVFNAGYVFGRTTWNLPAQQSQIFYTLRFGPKRYAHAHCDGGSLTLTVGDQRFLEESGRYKYDKTPKSVYLESARAHNGLTFSNDLYDEKSGTKLEASLSNQTFDWTVVSRLEQLGSSWRRGVYHSRKGQYLIVVDQAISSRSGGSSVQWQVPRDAKFAQQDNSVNVSVGASIEMVMHVFTKSRSHSTSMVAGQDDPMLGWRSESYGSIFAAPTLQVASDRGDEVYVTILATKKVLGHARPVAVDFVGDDIEVTTSYTNGDLKVRFRADGERLSFVGR
jgi:hypothetical protein